MSNTAAAGGAKSGPRKIEGFTIRFGTIAVGLSVVVLAVGLAIAGSSLWVSNGFKRSGAESATLMSSMRDHMTADMMHDSMRGVVFRAMYAALNNDPAMLADARAEVDEYGGIFRDSIAALSLPSLVVPQRAVDALSLVALADLVVSAGGTMNREAVALGTPVYTTFAGRLGAVDERLIADGRLRPLASADELVVARKDGVAPERVDRDPAVLLDLMLSALA